MASFVGRRRLRVRALCISDLAHVLQCVTEAISSVIAYSFCMSFATSGILLQLPGTLMKSDGGLGFL